MATHANCHNISQRGCNSAPLPPKGITRRNYTRDVSNLTLYHIICDINERLINFDERIRRRRLFPTYSSAGNKKSVRFRLY